LFRQQWRKCMRCWATDFFSCKQALRWEKIFFSKYFAIIFFSCLLFTHCMYLFALGLVSFLLQSKQMTSIQCLELSRHFYFRFQEPHLSNWSQCLLYPINFKSGQCYKTFQCNFFGQDSLKSWNEIETFIFSSLKILKFEQNNM
jgi:hypothetical protein